MRLSLVLLFSALLVSLASAAFLFEEPSARGAALGGATAALPDEPGGVAVNPALLSDWSGYGAMVGYSQPYNDYFTDLSFSGAIKLPAAGSVGFAWQNFGTTYLGQELTAENRFTIGHGFQLRQDQSMRFGFGYSFSMYTQSFGKSVSGVDPGDALGFGINLGAYARIWDRFSAGVMAQNINYPGMGETDAYDLPRTLAFAIAYNPYELMTTAFQVERTQGTPVRLRLGFEARPYPMVAIRLGASTEPVRFTGGLGVNWHGASIDYAYKHHTYLGATHLFTLTYHWPPPTVGSDQP